MGFVEVSKKQINKRPCKTCYYVDYHKLAKGERGVIGADTYDATLEELVYGWGLGTCHTGKGNKVCYGHAKDKGRICK